jgi:hypothetical protein
VNGNGQQNVDQVNEARKQGRRQVVDANAKPGHEPAIEALCKA